MVDFVENFKRDPFKLLHRVEKFVGLPSYEFRAVARRNAAGYWEYPGGSKSTKYLNYEPMSGRSQYMLDKFYQPYSIRLKKWLEAAHGMSGDDFPDWLRFVEEPIHMSNYTMGESL